MRFPAILGFWTGPFSFTFSDHKSSLFGRVMNGINAPKVLECKGSDGRRYKQLAKSGNDDLRQDAVRFQVLFFFAVGFAELV